MQKPLDQLSTLELGKLFPIILSEYSQEWKLQFEKEKKILQKLIPSAYFKSIHHFGSTAVEGFIAKPTIDILVVLKKDFCETKLCDKFTKSGYYYMDNLETHWMFVKGYTPQGFLPEVYHIHCWLEGDPEIKKRLDFKTILQNNKAIRDQYLRLKIKNQKLYEFNREAYTMAKSDFIREVLHVTT